MFNDLFGNTDMSQKMASGLEKAMSKTQELTQNLGQKAGKLLAQETVHCPACRAQLRSIAKYCDQCGVKLATDKVKITPAFEPDDFDFLNEKPAVPKEETLPGTSQFFHQTNDTVGQKPEASVSVRKPAAEPNFNMDDFDFLNEAPKTDTPVSKAAAEPDIDMDDFDFLNEAPLAAAPEPKADTAPDFDVSDFDFLL